MSDEKKTRRPVGTYHHGNLRRALIDAAAGLAGREGVESVSLRRVAALVGVSHAAPYHHFKNKADLLFEVGEEGFRRLDAAMVRAARKGRDAEDRLEAMGRAYVRFATRHPNYFRVMFRPELARSPEPDPSSAGQRAFRRLIEAVQACRGNEQGGLSDQLMLEVLYAWTIVHGLASLWVDGALSRLPPFNAWGITASIDRLLQRTDVGTNS